jgi:hypothetical protein
MLLDVLALISLVWCFWLAVDNEVPTKMEGLAHSWRCKWTNVVMKRRYLRRQDDEIIIETDSSADFEFRPANAECCAFYMNASILPFIVHYTDKHGGRREDAVIVCSNETWARTSKFISTLCRKC